ncbi:MAG: response regulator transcription factor [Bryobacterales bacterium]|nr:response regulator transcription factor [Bryobacterales bacterium]
MQTIRQVHAGKKRVQPEIASHLAQHMGEQPLTNRENELLRQVAEGKRNRALGERLFISEETATVHIKPIMEKLGASDGTHAVAIDNPGTR